MEELTHPSLAVLWSRRAQQLRGEQEHSELQRAVAALPHCPELWLQLLRSMMGRSTLPGADIFSIVKEALEKAGEHPAALPLWKVSLQLLLTPGSGGDYLARLVEGCCTLMSLVAPPSWREHVRQEVGDIISSLYVEGEQLLSSLPDIPSCSVHDPSLSELLKSREMSFPLTSTSLEALTASIKDGDVPIKWQRRAQFETFLAAYLEQDTAYHMNLNQSAHNSKLLSLSACYRVVSTCELDVWHAYLESESAAIVKSSDIYSVMKLYERAISADACMLYPEMWRKYVMWLMKYECRCDDKSISNEKNQPTGLSSALERLQRAICVEPLVRSHSLRVIYAHLLEYAGHNNVAKSIYDQIVLSVEVNSDGHDDGSGESDQLYIQLGSHTGAEDVADSGSLKRKRFGVNNELSSTNNNLEFFSHAISFLCRQKQFDTCFSLLRKLVLSLNNRQDRRWRNSLILMQSQLLKAQQDNDRKDYNTSGLLERLEILCKNNVKYEFASKILDEDMRNKNECFCAQSTCELTDLKLNSLLRHEDDIPLVKEAFDILLLFPCSVDRDEAVWKLLSGALISVTYGLMKNSTQGEIHESGFKQEQGIEPAAACPALVTLLRFYSHTPGIAKSIRFSLQAEELVVCCMSHLRQLRLFHANTNDG